MYMTDHNKRVIVFWGEVVYRELYSEIKQPEVIFS